MLEKYAMKYGKKLRYGYTTGSCACAASKAAVLMLITKKKLDTVKINTPKGWELDLKIENTIIKDNSVYCCVKKDAGDDPDITNGLMICSMVRWRDDNRIIFKNGKGVGTVTKKGLPVEIGNPAINPVPRKMITKEIREIIGFDKGIDVEISVPKGEEVAAKTFNPRLGIKGGISILGTTGIVEPMSQNALKETLLIELDMLKEKGIKNLVYVPGNMGKKIAIEMGIPKDNIIKISNFIGFMLDQAVDKNFESILIIGHIGKIVKVAGGIFNTHSYIADAKREILASYCALLADDKVLINDILISNTAEEVVNYIKEKKLEKVFQLLVNKISEKSSDRISNKINIGSIMYSFENGILATCEQGKKLMEVMKDG